MAGLLKRGRQGEYKENKEITKKTRTMRKREQMDSKENNDKERRKGKIKGEQGEHKENKEITRKTRRLQGERCEDDEKMES
ncbi:hypothetical protein ANN_20119 [Periplaneta americana]|uniref:Uncharacterized protein n=1 Tax=Periplaneta americana TaxID=6978 RepID=A0ABQ8SCF6_PERAM|nr:hypothetical protein ANN_20119 [Periplaneta americana]